MDPKTGIDAKIRFPFMIPIIGCASVFLATATFTVSCWIFFTQTFGTGLNPEDSTSRKCSLLFGETGNHSHQHRVQMNGVNMEEDELKVRSCNIFLIKYLFLLTINAFVCGTTALIQFCGTVNLLTGRLELEDFITRGRTWLIVNMGSNLVYVICFAATKTLPIPLELFLVKYLSGFWIILQCNIVLGSVLLILFLIRYSKELGAGLNNSSLVDHV